MYIRLENVGYDTRSPFFPLHCVLRGIPDAVIDVYLALVSSVTIREHRLLVRGGFERRR